METGRCCCCCSCCCESSSAAAAKHPHTKKNASFYVLAASLPGKKTNEIRSPLQHKTPVDRGSFFFFFFFFASSKAHWGAKEPVACISKQLLLSFNHPAVFVAPSTAAAAGTSLGKSGREVHDRCRCCCCCCWELSNTWESFLAGGKGGLHASPSPPSSSPAAAGSDSAPIG